MPALKRKRGRKSGAIWYVRIVANGRQRWRSLRTRRRPSRAKVVEVEAALWREAGRSGPDSIWLQPEGPVADLIGKFVDFLAARRSPGHVRQVERQLRRAASQMSAGDLSHWTASAINSFLQAGLTATGWAAGRSKSFQSDRELGPWSPHTAILYRQNIGRFLGWCVKRGIIERNPIGDVEKPSVNRELPEAFDEAEMRRWLKACREYDAHLVELAESNPKTHGDRRPWLERAVRIAIGSGMRMGELIAADWSSVNLRRRELVVKAAGSKSRTGRLVPLTPIAADALKATPAAERVGPLVPELQRNDSRSLQRALKRAGIDCRGRAWKRFRQWFAGRLFQAGVDPVAVQSILGHQDIRTTLRHYAAVTPKHVREVLKHLKI